MIDAWAGLSVPRAGLGPKWDKGIGGGLAPQGYNMLQTLGIRDSGAAPTREEIGLGVSRYISELVQSCLDTWPLLEQTGMLSTHLGHYRLM